MLQKAKKGIWKKKEVQKTGTVYYTIYTELSINNQTPLPLPYQNSTDKGENNLIVTSQELTPTDS